MRAPWLPSIARQVADYATASMVVPPPAQRREVERHKAPKESSTPSVRARVIEVFASASGRWLTMPAIRSRVGDDASGITVRVTVGDLHKEGRLLRMGSPGHYRYRMPLASR